ncbi:MAG: dTMP kinase [Dethiosulfatibacter sp.]|nr:dTMP kinase [Dethiosulfatibacter sp.]
MKKGLFIVLEGPDGAGKSTVSEMIAKYLQQKGHEIEFTREPGGTPIGEKIRGIILDNENTEMAATTEALLYAASRAQHVSEKIRPILMSGKTLICERFYHSSLVYQGIGRKLGVEKVRNINEFAIEGTYPDLVLFLDIDPAEALYRKKSLDGGDRLEQEHVSFHTDVYNGYKEIIKVSPEIKVIDASKSKDEVFKSVIEQLEKIL